MEIDTDAFNKLIQGFSENENKDEKYKIYNKTDLFETKEIDILFKNRIKADIYEIRSEYSYPKCMAYYSAAIKNYKRDLIKECLNKIKEEQKIELSVRSADMFFIAFLNRSVNEYYLTSNFKTDYNKREDKYITLTPKYKEHLTQIIELYRERVVYLLNYVIYLYKKIKSE